jgi:hypothetical protein
LQYKENRRDEEKKRWANGRHSQDPHGIVKQELTGLDPSECANARTSSPDNIQVRVVGLTVRELAR